MGGEQSATLVDMVEVVQSGVSNRTTVQCRCASANLVHDHKRPLSRVLENGRRFGHLDHERGLRVGQVI